MSILNGTGTPPPQVFGVETPLAYYTPVAITPGSIKWLVGGVIATIWSLIAAGVLFIPAKATDVENLSKIVLVLQDNQKAQSEQAGENRKVLERLTVAVDGLAVIVDAIRDAKPVVQAKPVKPNVPKAQ